MGKNRTSTFPTYLMVTFLLISTFITMGITESHIIVFPPNCPPGQKPRGNCRQEY
nr:U17_MYRTX_Mru1b [Myrmica ruginodis]